MAEFIKCVCPKCGQKYRLPVEYQGRHARCKKCSEKFEVPKTEKSLEDSVLDWLNEAEEQEAEAPPEQPRVITVKREPGAEQESAAHRSRGPIRLKSTTPTPGK